MFWIDPNQPVKFMIRVMNTIGMNNTFLFDPDQLVKLMIPIIFLKMHSGTKLYFFHFVVFVFGGGEKGGCQIPA